MSSPIRPPLTIETVDGATEGRPINTIKVSNGDLTVSGTTATIDTTGGGGGSGTVTSIATTAPITGGTITTTGTIAITQSATAADGYLSSTDWNTFDGKQDTLSLTTTGTSGAATLVGATLNIPQYAGGGGTFSGSLADTQVAFGNTTANSIQGSSNFTFDGSNLYVSGYIKVGSGSAAAPTYTFDLEPDTGMYQDGTNSISWSGGGVKQMNLAPDGVLTVGTGAATAIVQSSSTQDLKLQTNGGSNSGTIVITDGVDGGINVAPNGTGFVTLGNYKFDVDQTVGVGQDEYVLTYDHTAASISLAAGGGGSTGANPTATVSGTATNGVATTFMRSDAAPALAATTVTAASYTSADITVDAQGRITAASSGSGGGTFSGSLADTQVAFGNTTADSIQGSSSFTYDDTNKILAIAAGTGTPTLQSGSADLILRNSGAAAHSKITLGYDATNSYISLEPDGTGSIKMNTTTTLLSSKVVVVSDLNGTAMDIAAKNSATTATRTVLQIINGTTTTAGVGSGGRIQFRNGDDNYSGYNAGSIYSEQIDTANHNFVIEPQGTGKITLDGIEIDNSAAATDYVLTATSATAAGWAAAGGGGGTDFTNILPQVGTMAAATQYNIATAPPWGGSNIAGQAISSMALGARPFAFPFIAPETGTVSAVGVQVSTGESGLNMYVGIYSQDSNNLPSTRLGYATISLTSTGTIYSTSITGTLALTVGDQYWYSINTDANAFNAIVDSVSTFSGHYSTTPLGLTDDIDTLNFSIKDTTVAANAVPPSTFSTDDLDGTIGRIVVGLKF